MFLVWSKISVIFHCVSCVVRCLRGFSEICDQYDCCLFKAVFCYVCFIVTFFVSTKIVFIQISVLLFELS